MGEDSIGFSAKAPVSAWNKRIGVDYPGVFRALIKATIAYATGNAPAGLSATVDGFFAFKLEDRPLPPAELAWLLIRRALARAMARLSVEALAGRVFLGKENDTLITALDRGLDKAEVWIDPAFFDRPTDMPVLKAVRAQFDQWLRKYLHLDEAKSASVEQRLGAYFTFALRREWAEHFETYAPIDAEIRKLETPFAKATVRERAWLRNAAYLERQINEPVFDETFGLTQIYVPLRAWYREATPARKGRRRDEGETPERQHVVDLEQHLDAWFESGDKKDAIRVICGGPGSGKTSFAKIWAARLAQEGHRVLFVPLHSLELRDERPDIQAALWEFLHDLDVLPVDPLDSSEGEPRLLVLFDGLDELAMQGRAGQEVARNFVEAVERKLDLLNERKDRLIKVAFGGRDIAVQSARLPNTQILHVLPYHSAEFGFENAEEAGRYGCGRWSVQFGKAVGEEYHGVPEPLQNDDLADITAQPLLNYLLALSYRRGQLDFSAALNLNLLYRDLLEAIYDRRWGPGLHPIKKRLTRDEFDGLLDELGLAAWHGAGRTITEIQVEQACERAGLQEQLTAFQEGARAGAISLLAAFYFRQAAKIEGERTFEFTHKSFGQYLAARRLRRWMEDVHEERLRNRENRQRGWDIEDSLIRWIGAAGPAPLDHDLLDFLRREVALCEIDTVRRWQATFLEMLSDQLAHGLPMHRLLDRLQPPTFQEMTRQARNAEETLLACLHACAYITQTVSTPIWTTVTSFSSMVMRLQNGSVGPEINVLAAECIGYLDIRGQECLALDLSHSDISFSNLSGAVLAQALFWDANLNGANLSRANLFQANLTQANLDGTNLDGASLAGARIDLEWIEKLGLNAERLSLQLDDLSSYHDEDLEIDYDLGDDPEHDMDDDDATKE